MRSWMALAVYVSTVSTVFAADPDSFKMRTAKDLVVLCDTPAADGNYIAAIHFCHGFAAGAFQYYETSTSPEHRFVCLPDPPPTRSDAITNFLMWTKSHPEILSGRPVDAIFRFLGETYPCR